MTEFKLFNGKLSLRPGMVGVNLKGKADPSGTINTLLQGDAEAAHVWLVLPNGKIASTGAKLGFIYGEIEAEKYLKRRPFFLLETVDPLSNGQLAIIQAAHDEMMASGIKRGYGLWKFPALYALALKNGFVEKMGATLKTTAPAFPICSQAVGYPLWRAGVLVGKMFGKLDYTALLPQTFLDEAQAVAFMLAEGAIKPNPDKPQHYLKALNDRPYIF